LYNKSGIDTYFNNVALGVRCTSAHIKSETEILCILPKKDDNLDNKLVSINPQTLATSDIYSSQLTLYYVSYLKNNLYLGAFSLKTKKNYLLVDEKVADSPDNVNVIYEKENAIYFGSFQSELNNHTENYYLIKQTDTRITTELIEKGKIVFE